MTCIELQQNVQNLSHYNRGPVMSKRARSRKSQSRHNSKVASLASKYQRKGYSVWADHVSNYPSPDTYHGKIPDVVAKNDNGYTTMIEVETRDSQDTKRANEQKRRFSNWASRSSSRNFRAVIV